MNHGYVFNNKFAPEENSAYENETTSVNTKSSSSSESLYFGITSTGQSQYCTNNISFG